MVRRDSQKKPCRPKSTGREIPVSKSTQRAQEEIARLAFARIPSTYPGPQFVIILRHLYKLRPQENQRTVSIVSEYCSHQRHQLISVVFPSNVHT